MNTELRSVEKAIESLQKIESGELSLDEIAQCSDELASVSEMIKKLEDGIVRIAVFGQVNVGKSSLLNALMGRKVHKVGAKAGQTTDFLEQDWCEFGKAGLGRLKLADTPGINEVNGAQRADIARKVVSQSDLVLFVIAADTNEVEQQAIEELHALNKPIILVLNKEDLFKQQALKETIDSVWAKNKAMIPEESFVLTTSEGSTATIKVKNLDGSFTVEEEYIPPNIGKLQERIFDILEREGKELIAINAGLFAVEASEKVLQAKIKARKKSAAKVIFSFMVAKGSAVAINPIPFVDLGISVGSDVTMIIALAKVYGCDFPKTQAVSLLKTIVGSMGPLMALEVVTHVAAGLLETVSFGTAAAFTAGPQLIAAVWASYIIGNASAKFFENDAAWGEGGPKAVIREIVDNADKKSVLSPILKQISASVLAKKAKP